MSPTIQALFWGSVSGGALLIGAAIGYAFRSPTEASSEMQLIGRMMWRHPTLDPQIAPYSDLLAGLPCPAGTESCPGRDPAAGLTGGRFPADACRRPPDAAEPES